MPSIFDRKTNGDALRAIADTISALTYDEMLEFAKGVGADPQKVNQWAKDYLNPPPKVMPPPTSPPSA